MASVMTLSEAQQAAIARHIEPFRRYLETEGYRRFEAERKAHVAFFQDELPRRLAELSEADVEALLGHLWATAMWGNKAYLAQKIINDNGMERLREELKRLVEAADPEEAYGRFLRAVKGFGPASVTEMLAYLHPDRCGIWNRQAREALRLLGITQVVNVDKYTLSVQEYRSFNRLLRAIAHELSRSGIPDVDLLFVDLFLYYIVNATELETTSVQAEDFDHNEVRDLIAQIGTSLGFDTDTEVRIAHGAVVDVVWRARIANLGMVTYVFEVHRSGSIDSLILNLQKARNAPSVQKVIAVSDERQLEQIRRECEGLPEEFRRALRFWPVSEVFRTAEHLQKVMEAIEALGLLEDTN